MINAARRCLALAFVLACLTFVADAARAGDAAQPAGAAVPADAAPAAAMQGCPGKANGAPWCTSCQDKLAQGIDPSKSEGGCPCQRARKAREAAAAKAREAASAPAQ